MQDVFLYKKVVGIPPPPWCCYQTPSANISCSCNQSHDIKFDVKQKRSEGYNHHYSKTMPLNVSCIREKNTQSFATITHWLVTFIVKQVCLCPQYRNRRHNITTLLVLQPTSFGKQKIEVGQWVIRKPTTTSPELNWSLSAYRSSDPIINGQMIQLSMSSDPLIIVHLSKIGPKQENYPPPNVPP